MTLYECNLQKEVYGTACKDMKEGFCTYSGSCAWKSIISVDENNPYWRNVCILAEKQRKKGIETYGQGIECNVKPDIDKIQYIQEELIDALMYLEWLKDGLNKKVCPTCTNKCLDCSSAE